MRQRLPRPIRHALISGTVLIVLFIAAGIIYTFVADRTGSKPPPARAATAESSIAEPKPTPPSPNAPEGVSVSSLTSPVAAGSNAALTVQTNPGSTCTIAVVYNGVASKDSGLAAKPVGAYGVVTWSWTVEPTVPPGSWPVAVTCVYHGRSGVVQTNLQVTK